MMAVAGYVRTSTQSQDNSLQSQTSLLVAYGCEKFYVDRAANGREDHRTGLVSLFREVQQEDTIVATFVDRIWRSASRFIDMLAYLERMSIRLVILEPECSNLTSAGCEQLVSLARDAEADTRMTSRRTLIGLEEAKARGKRGGRRPVLTPEQGAELSNQYWRGNASYRKLAATWGISSTAVADYVHRYEMTVR